MIPLHASHTQKLQCRLKLQDLGESFHINNWFEQENDLAAIKEGAESLLPAEVCERYEECQRVQEEGEEMAARWRNLRLRLQKNLDRLDQKVSWEEVH